MSAIMPENLCRQIELTPAVFGAVSVPEQGTVQRRLQRDVGLAVKLMLRQAESMVRQLLNCRTKEEFCNQRDRLFPKYADSCLAISSMIRSATTDVDQVEMTQEAIASLMRVFRSEGRAYLGSEAKGEVLFCLSTLKKTFGMVGFMLAKHDLPPESEEMDSKLSRQFAGQVIFFQLNLECLRPAIGNEGSPNQEVLQEILEGLRISVMAYSTARQAMELRGFSEKRYAQVPDMSWDEEDEALAKF